MEGTFNRVSSIFFLIFRIGITVIMILAFYANVRIILYYTLLGTNIVQITQIITFRV